MSAGPSRVAVDTNILFFRAAASRQQVLSVLAGDHQFYVSESALAELFNHKEKILAASSLDPDEIARAYHALLVILELYKERLIPAACWTEAYELCRGIEEKDTPHVALTLALDGLLWTGDKVLRAGLMGKGFNRFFIP